MMIINPSMIFWGAYSPSHILSERSLCWVLDSTCRSLGGCHSIIIIDADINYVDIPALLCEIVLPRTTSSGRILIVYHIFKNFIIDLRIGIL